MIRLASSVFNRTRIVGGDRMMQYPSLKLRILVCEVKKMAAIESTMPPMDSVISDKRPRLGDVV